MKNDPIYVETVNKTGRLLKHLSLNTLASLSISCTGYDDSSPRDHMRHLADTLPEHIIPLVLLAASTTFLTEMELRRLGGERENTRLSNVA